jgi:hypothetical protein
MEVQQDFRDLLALFNAHKVNYIIVGAHALAYHGAPRFYWASATCRIFDPRKGKAHETSNHRRGHVKR